MKCLSHWLESIKTIFLFVNFNVVRTCFTSVFFSSLPFNRTHRNDSELELLVSSFLFWSKQNEKEDAKMRRLHENQKHADGVKCREETLQWTKPICHTLRARKVTENNRRTMMNAIGEDVIRRVRSSSKATKWLWKPGTRQCNAEKSMRLFANICKIISFVLSLDFFLFGFSMFSYFDFGVLVNCQFEKLSKGIAHCPIPNRKYFCV